MTPSSAMQYMGVLWCMLGAWQECLSARQCHKVDPCTCVFDDGSGTVDLSKLGRQDGTPLVNDVSNGDYLYSYNPCYNFTEKDCTDAAGCQTYAAGDLQYKLGDQASVKFNFDGTNLQASYSHVGPLGKDRKLTVTFVCDQSASTPSVNVLGEVEMLKYAITINSSEVCPQNPPVRGSCDKLDQCRCKFKDGAIIDIGTIGRQDGIPLFKDVPAPDGNLYSYNPCYPFTEHACENTALCQHVTNVSLYYRIGDESTDAFFYDGVNLFVRYQSNHEGVDRTSVVTFECDSQATSPTIRALGEVAPAEYLFTVTSNAACPQSPPSCTKVDNCKCTMSDGSGTVDLSKLGRQTGEPLISDVMDPTHQYAYSFNPCYSFSEGTCVNKSACLLEIQAAQYYDIGTPSATFMYDGNDVIGTYTASDGVRRSIVKYICDHDAIKPTIQVEGELSPSVYGFRVTSRDACPVKV